MTEVILCIIRQGDVVTYAGETKMKKETNWFDLTLLIDERGVPVLKKNIVSKIDELFIFSEDFVTLTNRCVSTEQR